jgi:heme exporter protein D
MADLASWLAMGGYAPFIWPAYAVTAVVLVALLWSSLRMLNRRAAELARLEEARRR